MVATALAKDLVCEQTKRKGVCDREIVSVGDDHTCGVTSEGFIECFGSDDLGQSNKHEPKKARNGKFVQVSAGEQHTCGVTSEGFIECFGSDKHGRCNKHEPRKARNGKFVQVSAGVQRTCGVTSEGFIECFGVDKSEYKPKEVATKANNLGGFIEASTQYGRASTKYRRASTQQPLQAKEGSKVGFVQVSVGSNHMCGVTSEGFIECIGYKQREARKKYEPRKPSGKFEQVSVGDFHTCGVTDKGFIECFGDPKDLQEDYDYDKPKLAINGSFVQLSVGITRMCGVTDKGYIECFGNPKDLREDYEYDKPKLAIKGKFLQVSVGVSDTCGFTSEGRIECFGKNEHGQSKGHQPYILNNRAPRGQYLKSGKYHTCNRGYFNDLTGQRSCKLCDISNGMIPTDDRKQCIRGSLSKSVKNLQLALANQKEKMDELSNKNSRLWQKEVIRQRYDKLMQARKAKDDKDENDACIAESQAGTIIFPAVEIDNEIEKIDDTTCIDTNREELLKSFCSFTSDLDKLFKIQGIAPKAKTFWPNICCKERNDKMLEVCQDPTNTIKRENIVPFALSQGGQYSRHNLYSEVKESIKQEGYLHAGMKKLINSLPSVSGSKKTELTNLTTSFFHGISLCGPRIVDAPGVKDRKKLCQLFIPYQHSMTQFYRLIESLFTQPQPMQPSMLETMESSFRKRQAGLGQNKLRGMETMMKSKPTLKSGSDDKACKVPGNEMLLTDELEKKKREFCKGYNHLDLSNANVKNIAVHYVENDILIKHAEKDKWMNALNSILRYQVTDTSCPSSPLFTPKDVSIQQVAMNVSGSQKQWAAVVNLNTKDDDGYLQSELPECERKGYLIGAKVIVSAFMDKKNCCGGEPNWEKCMKLQEITRCAKGKCSKSKCANELEQLPMKGSKRTKTIELMGTTYWVESGNQRRTLLQTRHSTC
eukprot:g5.t1